MTEEAFGCNCPGEVREAVLLKAWRHIPNASSGIVRDWRLEKVIRQLDDKGVGVASGADDVGNRIFRADASPLDGLG